MKRKLLLVTLFTLSLLGTRAQGLLSHLDDTMSNRSLFERVMNMEKKTNRFNLKLHMQATFNGTFSDGSLEQAAFKMNQLRLEARGDINDWLSYRWRQRLNSSNTPHALDNLPSSIDYAMISVRLTDKFTTSIGKQAAAYGGFEYDLDPIEIYQYSDMIDYMLFDFMTGITFSYQVNPTQEIGLASGKQPDGLHERYIRATSRRHRGKQSSARLFGQLEREFLQQHVQNPLVLFLALSSQEIQ